ncbi:MAG: GMP synthase [Bacteroidetes bacterium]|nr:MAG: GMP synthase [Bacteroidota bacterium]
MGKIKVAILDLYEGVANQGMRCIREILHCFADLHHLDMQVDEFEVRQKLEVPNCSYHIYISSGGPGSPLDSEGSAWENAYFEWLRQVEDFNSQPHHYPKKHVLFICHSFQLACRHYAVGSVCARKSTSFGVFPVHMLGSAVSEPVFYQLNDPFYAVDSRDFQVIEPNYTVLQQMGGSVLCIEKDRPHVALERAIMAVRFNDYFIGTQFHPEADAVGMSLHLQTPEKKKTVVENHGEAKWQSMIDHLNDPDKIMYTHQQIIPNFLNLAVGQFQMAQA